MPILPVRTSQHLQSIQALWRAYAESLGAGGQGIEAECPTLPGPYVPPDGELLLATDADGQPLGCVALRREDAESAEVKRLYVAPAARGQGLARALAVAVVEVARSAGYRRVVLDSLPSMLAAIALYRSLGFDPIAPYNDSTLPGLQHFARAFDPGQG